MKNIKIIEVPSEIGAGTRGASLGVEAIKIAALDFMSSLFINIPREKIEDENNLLYEPIESPHARRIKGVLKMWERISESVNDCIHSGFFPIVLSGDHSNAGGTLAGLKKANPNKKLGVIWIDAHADIHTPYTSPSGNMHGMPLAASIADDNMECKVHKLDKNTTEYWDKLKNIGKIKPKIKPEHLVYIALRDFEKEEEALIKKHNIKVIPVSEVRKKGIAQVTRNVFQYLNDCDEIYISFDVDSMDSSISRGTGTPVANGLKAKEAEDLLATMMQNHKVCCLEITEVNPTLDKENLMAEIAFTILQRCINQLMLT